MHKIVTLLYIATSHSYVTRKYALLMHDSEGIIQRKPFFLETDGTRAGK